MSERRRGPVDEPYHWSGRLLLDEAGHVWEWLPRGTGGWLWYGPIEEAGAEVPPRLEPDLEQLRVAWEGRFDARAEALASWWQAKTR